MQDPLSTMPTWALDDDTWARLIRAEPVDPRLLARALTAGRVRGIGIDLLGRMLARPHGASGVMRRGLREARALHSRERRFVGDALHAVARLHGLLGRAGDGSAEALWLVWCRVLGAEAGAVEAAAAELGVRVDVALAADLRVGLVGLAGEAWVSAVASVPPSAVGPLVRALGASLPAFLVASAERAPIGLRPIAPRADLAGLSDRLRAAGVDVTPTRVARGGLLVPAGTDLTQLTDGPDVDHLVQDDASQAVAERVVDAPGLRVLDLCAGAGGKSLTMATLGASVTASDVRQDALDELSRRADRAGLRVRVVPPDRLTGTFDVVLVDAPCSGTGVWRRHPELRWRLDELPALAATQRDVLTRGASLVRPGGRLVYATCSVLEEEGADRVAAFLAEHAGWLPQGAPLATRPDRDSTDGFFALSLARA